MLEEALKKHREGDHEGAGKIYREILAEQPERDDVHHLLALLEHEKGNADTALEHVERAIELKDDRAVYYQTLGSVLHRRGDLAGARANMERAVELDPNLPQGHNTLGYLQYLQGDLAAAEQSLRVALKIEPDSHQVLTNLGNVYLAQGRLEDARTQLNQALEIQPDSVAARASLGRTLLAEGGAAFAEECFRRCLQARPGNPTLQAHLAQAVLANGRSEEARELFEAVLDDEPAHFDALVGLGDVARSQERYRDAVRRYQQALVQRRGDSETVEKMADALMALGEFQAASQCYQTLAARRHESKELKTKLGQALEALGQTDAATQTLQAALKDNPGDADAALALSQLHARSGGHQQGIDVLDALPEDARSRSRVRVTRARHLLALGRSDDAMAELEAVPKTSDWRKEALELMGRAHDAEEEYERAGALFSELAAMAETPPPAVSKPAAPVEQAGHWPKEPPDDGRGEAVFIAGLPGSGIHAVVEALDELARVEVLQDRFSSRDPRRDFLTDRASIADWDELDDDDLRRVRRKYWNAVRHARRRYEPGVAGIDRLPVELVDPVAIARYFPQATLLVVTRHPGDHLLHSESFGWRDDAAPTQIDLEDFYGNLKAAADTLALRVIRLDFDRLRDGDDQALRDFFDEVGASAEGFAEQLSAQLRTADGLERYWPAGHWTHYREALGLDQQALDALTGSMGLES